MPAARRSFVLLHRSLAYLFGLLILVWFLSGIAMVFTGGMPRLDPDDRLLNLAPVDLSRVALSPADAAARAGIDRDVNRAVLIAVVGRPAYQFVSGTTTVVFADDGRVLERITPDQSVAIARLWRGVSPARVRHAGELHEPDQWTVGQNLQMPLHKLLVDDGRGSEMYVSEQLGEVVLVTDRWARALAWLSAIPHWLYFAPLRRQPALWRQVMLWSSGISIAVVMLGLVLAVTQYRARYAGLLRWHYRLGWIAGVFALTWMVSGWLSLEPWWWTSGETRQSDVERAIGGRPLDVRRFTTIPALPSERTPVQEVKEIELRQVFGEPYFVFLRPGARAMLSAATDQHSFDSSRFRTQLERALAHVPHSTTLLSKYDSYYRDRTGRSTLPILRLTFEDRERTWVYVNPATATIVAQFSRRQRIERWAYHGLHSLDFWNALVGTPAWRTSLVALCVAGSALSALGLLAGVRRLITPVNRRRRAAAPSGT